jgi:hypothetical protein
MTKAINRQPSRLSFWGLLVDEVKGREETQGLSCQGIKEVRRETRLTTAGHVLLAGAVLALACAVVVVGRREAQSRQSLLGYCNRAPIQLLESFSPSGTIAPSPMPPRGPPPLELLALNVPIATLAQRQRLAQQAREIKQLSQYHCKSMQFFSESQQALATMANGSATLAATMLGLLSLHGLQTAIRWPFTVLLASAFSLSMAVVSIQGFHLHDNARKSRVLFLQTLVIARAFATGIANQDYRYQTTVLPLRNPQSVGVLLRQIDAQLAVVDSPIFFMNESFSTNEFKILLHNILTTESNN